MKIIEICDVNAKGHTVRLDTGEYRLIPHSTAELQVGAEVDDREAIPVLHGHMDLDELRTPRFHESGHTTVEQMNSRKQVLGNVLSEVVKHAVDTPPEEIPPQ